MYIYTIGSLRDEYMPQSSRPHRLGWLVAYLAPSHYLNQCFFIVKCKWKCRLPNVGHFYRGPKGFIARRHGHVFRMALHNEGDWRMETWQRARRASCHVSIRQSPSCVMPFWTHAKCLLAFISYLPMWIKAKYTFIKTVYSPRFYGGPYLQAKHADVCSGVLFWTACTRRPRVLSLPSSSGCEKSDSWRQARSVKTAKKSHERYHNVVMWHWIVYKWRRSNRWYVLSGTGFLVAHQLYIGNVMRKYKIGKSSPHQPCENTCHSNVLELSLLWMARALACF